MRIAPASWSEPDPGDWVEAVGRAYREAVRHDDRVVLGARGLGCWAAAAWREGNPSRPVAGAFPVAPPDPHGPAFPSAAGTFPTVPVRPLLCPALVVGSGDDPYCTPETAAGLAGAYGQLNSASGLGAWPYGRGLLDSLIR
ncbi:MULTISPECIES: RBBP9/YdeN family alpha/beta hydrolase [unclassified Streptomyces]|uniref:RBBP9/YdeN family alpha/beta hydrolase n=1 Tax=unclassified Streptomyces TaxID=2593676 RepID=UPI0027D7723A|nr:MULTISPECIES: alpha/beta hydrolase [unclassified Streptomyces]